MEEALARGVQLFLALTVGYIVASWFVLAVWAYRDIGTRSKSVVTQVLGTLIVVLFWVPGALLYLMLRPKDTIDDVYQRSLEEEYLIHDLEEVPVCHSCHRQVEADYVVCPHCQADLKESCAMCGKLISPQWDICPYCASTSEERAALIREQLPATEERFIDRGERTIRPLPGGRDQIREVSSGQREALVQGPDAPSLESGYRQSTEVGDSESVAEEPIRLFDRKQTRMRNENLERATDSNSDSANGAHPYSNGHVSDSDEIDDSVDAVSDLADSDESNPEQGDTSDAAEKPESASASRT